MVWPSTTPPTMSFLFRPRTRPLPQPVNAHSRKHSRQSAYAAARDPHVLETSAELALAAFFMPFELASVPDAVHKLIGAGYTSPSSLGALGDDELHVIQLAEGDGEKVMLAAWLQGVGLVQHGHGLVVSTPPIVSLLNLVDASDDQLKAAGMKAIGHRRQLQRALREDEQVQAMRARALEALEEKRGARQARGLNSSSDSVEISKKQLQNSVMLLGGGGASADGGSLRTLTIGLEQHNAALQLRSLPGVGGVGVVGGGTSRDAWHLPWRTMANASLANGPGEVADSHYGSTHTGGAIEIGGDRMW